MTLTVVDASALGAVTFQEPGFEQIAARLHGATIVAPHLLKFELANVALVKTRRQPAQAARFVRALAEVLSDRAGIAWHDVNPSDAALLALATGLTVYDASYLLLAGTLGADLVTLDRELAAVVAADPDSSVV